MYLYRLTLDPGGHQARRDLGDAYEMHRTLTRAFVTNDQQQPERFLWRLESGSGGWSKPQVLVQAAHAANWTPLIQLDSYLLTGDVESRQFDPEQWLAERPKCRFRLLANPTVTRQGKRFGLIRESEQLEWLERQGARHGFKPDVVLVTQQEKLRARKGELPITLLRVCFEGYLSVANRTQLASAMASGIGPGKALGCGLLSLG